MHSTQPQDIDRTCCAQGHAVRTRVRHIHMCMSMCMCMYKYFRELRWECAHMLSCSTPCAREVSLALPPAVWGCALRVPWVSWVVHMASAWCMAWRGIASITRSAITLRVEARLGDSVVSVNVTFFRATDLRYRFLGNAQSVRFGPRLDCLFRLLAQRRTTDSALRRSTDGALND